MAHRLMVLCPFVCLLTTPGPVELRPQPSEVASIQWVPLRALLSPERRTKEMIDISGQMGKDRGWLLNVILRSTLGKMTFSAIRLLPSESLHCSSIEGFIPSKRIDGIKNKICSTLAGHNSPSLQPTEQPPQLWGLTLGMVADFLDMFPPGDNSVKLWAYPTFTNPDLRLILWLITYSLRKANGREVMVSGGRERISAVDASTAAMAVDNTNPQNNEAGISGLGLGRPNHTRLVSTMLDGYFTRLHWAIVIWLSCRAAIGSAAAICLIRYLRKRRG